MANILGPVRHASIAPTTYSSRLGSIRRPTNLIPQKHIHLALSRLAAISA